MLIPIVYYSQKENKSDRKKGAIVMKKNITMETSRSVTGYELLRKGIPSGLIKEYWAGSPWRALRDCVRGM